MLIIPRAITVLTHSYLGFIAIFVFLISIISVIFSFLLEGEDVVNRNLKLSSGFYLLPFTVSTNFILSIEICNFKSVLKPANWLYLLQVI